MSNEDFREQLSAFVDDELRTEESAFFVRRLTQSEEALDDLERYYLIGAVLRADTAGLPSTGFSGRVSAALDAEPAHSGARPALGRRFLRPAAGLAVAASVAALSVGFWTNQPQSPATTSTATPNLAGASTPMIAPVAADTAPSAGPQQWERLDPEVRKRLNGYLVNHSEYSASRHVGGVLTYVRIAGQQNAE